MLQLLLQLYSYYVQKVSIFLFFIMLVACAKFWEGEEGGWGDDRGSGIFLLSLLSVGRTQS